MKKGITREEGYAIGIRKIGDVLNWCKANDVKMLTMWGFSTDNFKRDPDEIKALFGLFRENLAKGIGEATGGRKEDTKKVRVRFFGRLHLLPNDVQQMIRQAERMNRESASYQLNLLLSYGGRDEIVDAVNAIIKKGVKEVDEKTISKNLYTHDISDPDLIIRTSGEQRLSGLMPWQSCYSEFYFCKKLWPDFSRKDLEAALKEYARRMRRFGK